MHGVVDEGSASGIFEDYSISVGGKTGTAQVGSKVSDNALFVAFAPFDNPEIAVAVVAENANTGSATSQVAAKVYNYYFGEKEKIDISQTPNTLIG